MQEAFLAAVNKSRQRQPIKGCCVWTAGPHGTKLASGGGDRTQPVRSCRDTQHPTSELHHQHSVKLREGPGAHGHKQIPFKINPEKNCFAFHKRVGYKHIKIYTRIYLTACYKPNIKIISKSNFHALFYSWPSTAILFLATVSNREAGKYFTMITHKDCIRSYTHTRQIRIMHSVFHSGREKTCSHSHQHCQCLHLGECRRLSRKLHDDTRPIHNHRGPTTFIIVLSFLQAWGCLPSAKI